MLSRGVEVAYERRGPMTRGQLCEVGRMALFALYQTLNLHLTFTFTVERPCVDIRDAVLST